MILVIDYCDILNHYFLEYYKETNTKELSDSFKEVLWYLSFDNKYIKFEEGQFPIGDLGEEVNHNGAQTVLTLDFAKTWWKQGIKTKITPSGRYYISEIVRSEKQDEINETLKANSNVQKKTAIAVGIFTALNVFIAGITLYQNSTKRTSQDFNRIAPEARYVKPIVDSRL